MKPARYLGRDRQQQLFDELDAIETAIARSRTFRRTTDADGRSRITVSPELLTLVEREYSIVTELRHHHGDRHRPRTRRQPESVAETVISATAVPAAVATR